MIEPQQKCTGWEVKRKLRLFHGLTTTWFSKLLREKPSSWPSNDLLSSDSRVNRSWASGLLSAEKREGEKIILEEREEKARNGERERERASLLQTHHLQSGRLTRRCSSVSCQRDRSRLLPLPLGCQRNQSHSVAESQLVHCRETNNSQATPYNQSRFAAAKLAGCGLWCQSAILDNLQHIKFTSRIL